MFGKDLGYLSGHSCNWIAHCSIAVVCKQSQGQSRDKKQLIVASVGESLGWHDINLLETWSMVTEIHLGLKMKSFIIHSCRTRSYTLLDGYARAGQGRPQHVVGLSHANRDAKSVIPSTGTKLGRYSVIEVTRNG